VGRLAELLPDHADAVKGALRKAFDRGRVAERSDLLRLASLNGGLVRHLKSGAWDPDLHPRSNDGRFVDAHDLAAAKSDPAKADELRAQVTDPDERKKLEAAIGPPGGDATGALDPPHPEGAPVPPHEDPEFHDRLNELSGEPPLDAARVALDAIHARDAKATAELASVNAELDRLAKTPVSLERVKAQSALVGRLSGLVAEKRAVADAYTKHAKDVRAGKYDDRPARKPRAPRKKPPGGPVKKAWSEDDHPRGDDGRFVAGEDLRDAKSDPAKAAELRARVTDPAERAKLDAAIGGAAEGKPAEPVPEPAESFSEADLPGGDVSLKNLDTPTLERRYEAVKQSLEDAKQRLIAANNAGDKRLATDIMLGDVRKITAERGAVENELFGMQGGVREGRRGGRTDRGQAPRAAEPPPAPDPVTPPPSAPPGYDFSYPAGARTEWTAERQAKFDEQVAASKRGGGSHLSSQLGLERSRAEWQRKLESTPVDRSDRPPAEKLGVPNFDPRNPEHLRAFRKLYDSVFRHTPGAAVGHDPLEVAVGSFNLHTDAPSMGGLDAHGRLASRLQLAAKVIGVAEDLGVAQRPAPKAAEPPAPPAATPPTPDDTHAKLEALLAAHTPEERADILARLAGAHAPAAPAKPPAKPKPAYVPTPAAEDAHAAVAALYEAFRDATPESLDAELKKIAHLPAEDLRHAARAANAGAKPGLSRRGYLDAVKSSVLGRKGTWERDQQ
jgi:hypothetical protein